jgi:hypothetical protein
MGLLKTNLFILVISFWGLSIGSARADEDAPTFHVQQVDPSFESQKMAGPGVKVHGAEEMNEGSWESPDPQVRDKIFAHAGLKRIVGSWDALDLNILFNIARNSTEARLFKSYPKLPKDQLAALSKLAKTTKNEGGRK